MYFSVSKRLKWRDLWFVVLPILLILCYVSLQKAIEEQSNGRLRESFSPTLLNGRTPLNKDSLTLKQVGIVDDDTVIGFLARDTRALIESAGLQPF
jgi:hypothetical protein